MLLPKGRAHVDESVTELWDSKEPKFLVQLGCWELWREGTGDGAGGLVSHVRDSELDSEFLEKICSIDMVLAMWRRSLKTTGLESWRLISHLLPFTLPCAIGSSSTHTWSIKDVSLCQFKVPLLLFHSTSNCLKNPVLQLNSDNTALPRFTVISLKIPSHFSGERSYYWAHGKHSNSLEAAWFRSLLYFSVPCYCWLSQSISFMVLNQCYTLDSCWAFLTIS